MPGHNVVLAFSCALASGALGGCARRTPPPVRPEPITQVEPEERLGVEDVLEIRIVGESELSGKYKVSADGSLSFPYVGRVTVAGLRPAEVQDLLTTRLKDGYLRNPQLTITVSEWNSRKISVLGQVTKPGPVAYFPNMTIVDAIAAAGGFTPLAQKNAVTLRRERSGSVVTQNYRVADISEGGAPNVVILPGDVLVVEERLF